MADVQRSGNDEQRLGPTEPATPVTILFVAGTGRSGTTIVNTILGQLPGFLAVGEVRYIWERGFGENHRCGCGEMFDECPLWTQVVERAFGEAGPPDPQTVSTDLLGRLRMMRVPAMIARAATGRPAIPPHPHDEAIARLYRAVTEVHGPVVIVDSSKLPPYGKLLEQLPGVRFFVLHIVRDPRANAFSWQRVKKTHDRDDDDATMERLGPARSTAMWLVWNTLVSWWWRTPHPQHLRLRYEDFAERPRETMAQVARMLDVDPGQLPFLDDRTVRVVSTHAVAGNPNRHARGQVTLRADDEWRRAMPRRQRLAVTVMALPGLRRFGYGLRG